MNTIKTLVELFDECQIANVISALNFHPEKIVFVGFNKTMKMKKRNDIRKFFDAKGLNIDIEFEIVGRFDYDFIIKKLIEITDENEDCVFDLTGGKELVLAAMGEVAHMKNLAMIQIDIPTGKLINVKNSNHIAPCGETDITIDESLILNGGIKISKDKNITIDDEYKKDLDTMWEICRENCVLWNRQVTEFERAERIKRLKQHNFYRHYEFFINEDFISKLEKAGLLKEFTIDGDEISFKFKNRNIEHCMEKAGNILEMYAYKALNEINEKEHTLCDIDVSVSVDWDGDGDEGKFETTNEIDLVLMKKHIPIFISCKNGEVSKEALYELEAVSRHFGGEYSKKILLCSYISVDKYKREYILQRARDMKIEVLHSVHKMSGDKLLEELKKRVV